jgi:MerR family transcriptional regulator, mercuric resistance operon regulatory protein
MGRMLKPVVTTDSTHLERGSVAVARSAGIQIGELSRRTGCNIETIRYYERIYLLPAPVRSAGRYRVYDTADVRRLAFIRRARELGFTLDEVRTLLALSANDAQGACAEVRELAASHLAEVRAKIADLRAMERVLADAVRRCAAGELPGCPVIDALSAV